MEKLIKLLNEYNIELHWVDRTYKDGFDLWYEQEYMRDFRVAYLISKSFWFIKRLVDKEKIDRDKILKENWLFRKYFYDLEYVKNYDRLVMWLSVEDNPTKFLISNLK